MSTTQAARRFLKIATLKSPSYTIREERSPEDSTLPQSTLKKKSKEPRPEIAIVTTSNNGKNEHSEEHRQDTPAALSHRIERTKTKASGYAYNR